MWKVGGRSGFRKRAKIFRSHLSHFCYCFPFLSFKVHSTATPGSSSSFLAALWLLQNKTEMRNPSCFMGKNMSSKVCDPMTLPLQEITKSRRKLKTSYSHRHYSSHIPKPAGALIRIYLGDFVPPIMMMMMMMMMMIYIPQK